ncbi:MAG: hypothetical protein M3020_25910 [Myxococcota bacterium]|nr:hypothetical protein [Myxococcota bacterium]
MDSVGLPFEGAGYRSPKGRLGVWTPSPALLVVQFSGHGDKSFVRPIVEAFERLLAGDAPLHVFFDAGAMPTYDSELRTGLTGRLFDDRARISAFHVLSTSKLTSMGVSVANLALGGIITLHSERAPFSIVLDATLARQQVTGFSSKALSP